MAGIYDARLSLKVGSWASASPDFPISPRAIS